jgi:hypothetical protein
MTSPLSLSTKFERNTGFIQTDIDGETVMMNIENGEYYGLAAVASQIWQLLETPTDLQTIIEKLLCEYDVTIEQCQLDVTEFIQSMLDEEIVKFVNLT